MKKKFDIIYDDVIATLDNKLPAYLKYHCTAHTKYVVKKAEYIATKENLSAKKIFLIKVAALYHDIGFINGPGQGHEKRGCKHATKELKKYKFTEADIKKICGMIMATKIPQEPQNILEEVLADADLEYLATNHFKEVGDFLLEEIRHDNENLSVKKWNEIQVNFMSSHSFHTNYCKRYKEFRKIKNMEKLKH